MSAKSAFDRRGSSIAPTATNSSGMIGSTWRNPMLTVLIMPAAKNAAAGSSRNSASRDRRANRNTPPITTSSINGMVVLTANAMGK